MIVLLLVVHILIAIALVGVVLLQKSEGGALGIGGGGMSGFMTGRSTANLLTRATAILAAAFFATSILLVIMHNRQHAPRSIVDQGTAQGTATTPILPPVSSTPAKPAGAAKTAAPPAPAPAKAPAAPPSQQPSAPLAR